MADALHEGKAAFFVPTTKGRYGIVGLEFNVPHDTV